MSPPRGGTLVPARFCGFVVFVEFSKSSGAYVPPHFYALRGTSKFMPAPRNSVVPCGDLEFFVSPHPPLKRLGSLSLRHG